MPPTRPSQEPHIDAQQLRMAQEDIVCSHLNWEEFNRPSQVFQHIGNISGGQKGALRTHVAGQVMLYLGPSRQQSSPLERFTFDAGTRRSSESKSTFLDSFADMAPYSSGNQSLQHDLMDKSNDMELPSAVMGDLVQYESIGPLELDDIENSRFECDSSPSWKDIATSPPLTPTNDSKPLVRQPHRAILPQSIGTAELLALFDEDTDELPALFDEDLVLPFPEDSDEEESEALLSQSPPPTSQRNQNAIHPSRPTALDESPPPRPPDDRIDQLPPVETALRGSYIAKSGKPRLNYSNSICLLASFMAQIYGSTRLINFF